ncbi:glycogen debranching enzyme [Marinomonas sp. MED121]|uniref:glycogen debranching protein GlgX n=1 Tax=Marinomonas sp. MED121 TaxID=314277 RepID=UPI0000690FEE|nr:glycogen debranching protein GlgX [Marinomonas sp. MED121]EAQ67180.1 glycogen debranching enzyme [Marinomonas sp. MED121]
MPAQTAFVQTQGAPFPLGATLTEQGVNFAVYSKHAKQVLLCLFDEAEMQEEQIALNQKSQGIWHGEIKGIKLGQRYAYRVKGHFNPEEGHLYNTQKLLIDPYAKQLSDKLHWHPDQNTLTQDKQINTSDSAHCVPKSIVLSKDQKALHPLLNPVKAESRCLYELHVKGFTQQLNIADRLKGKYLGLIEPESLAHLKSLGVTSLQILPCFAFASEMRLKQLGLKNFWGYNPINFFTPDFEYALEDPVAEFKLMVEGLHKAGFEVILDVVYNHTYEGERHQACISFKGIDNKSYYRSEQGEYLNFTGCGNCFDTYQPISIRLIMDSMRYWLEIMGVDGFRFDLGVDLGRTQHDFDINAPLLNAMLQDPIISNACLITEPWDIGPNGYQLGQFPQAFLECNDKYRDNIKRFWRGDKAQVQEFATRIMGSRDTFHKGHKSALQSINYVSYHDGFTLHDLVSYQERHNLANKEDNKDGHGENISQNFGHEGETIDEEINLQRLNQQSCLIATLLLSQGTPHILAGDELSNTQMGNNNAYCQDNEIAWLDWTTSAKRTLLENQISQLLALRKQHPILAECRLEDDELFNHNIKDKVIWLNENNEPMSHEDWHLKDRDFISLILERCNDTGSLDRLWLGFYRGNNPLSIPVTPFATDTKLLFSTQGVSLTKDTLDCAYASVFLIQI